MHHAARAPADQSTHRKSLADARAAWHAGEFALCLDTLDDVRVGTPEDHAECVLLRARAQLGLNRPEEARNLLDRVAFASIDASVTAEMLRCAGLSREGDVRAAIARFEMLKESDSFRSAHATIQAETEYHYALALYLIRDLKPALEATRRVYAIGYGDIISARASALEAWIFTAMEQYTDALNQFRVAFQRLRACTHRDVHHESRVVLSYAALSADVAGERTAALSEEMDTSAFWPAAMADSRAQVLRCRAWSAAVSNDAQGAAGFIRAARDVAPSPQMRVIMLAESSAIARAFDQSVFAADFALAAKEIASTVDWKSISGEEIFGLLVLADQLAESDVEGAKEALEQFERLSPNLSPLLALHADRRAIAYVRSVRANVHAADLASGRTFDRFERQATIVSIVDDLSAAMTFYRDAHFYWRASLCALQLFRLQKTDAMLELAWMFARKNHAGRSFVIAKLPPLVTVLADPRTTVLTKAERGVLIGALQGKSKKEMAAETNRSENTIRNHLVRVYKAFGVKTQIALVAACAHSSAREKTILLSTKSA